MEYNKRIVEALYKLHYKISTAESVTGGKIISNLIEVPGASKITEQSFIVYSDNAKIETLGINKSFLKEFGVVSEEMALEMARKTKAITNSNVVISSTGEAGPVINEKDIVVGTIYFGLIINNKEFVRKKIFTGNRLNIMNDAVSFILNELLTKLP